MNEGKKFEQDFRNSMPEDVFYYRLRDGTAAWSGGENTRFQQTNICDCLLFHGHNLYMLELKSHKGKSIPFTAFRQNQLEGLVDAENKGVKAGFVINMRNTEQTFYVPASALYEVIQTSDRKSIPLEFLTSQCKQIVGEKKRTRWRYDVERFLVEI